MANRKSRFQWYCTRWNCIQIDGTNRQLESSSACLRLAAQVQIFEIPQVPWEHLKSGRLQDACPLPIFTTHISRLKNAIHATEFPTWNSRPQEEYSIRDPVPSSV